MPDNIDPMTEQEIHTLFRTLRAQGKSLSEIRQAGIDEVKRRRLARIRRDWQRECAEKDRLAWEEIKANPPAVDPDYVARQRALDEQAKMICEALWHDVWNQTILPRAKGAG